MIQHFRFLTLSCTEDTTPPVVDRCPDSFILNQQPGSPSRVVTWIEPIAVDDSGVAPRVIQSHFSGDEFSLGTTEVTYSFVDDSQNVATCSFSITIGKWIVRRYFSPQCKLYYSLVGIYKICASPTDSVVVLRFKVRILCKR